MLYLRARYYNPADGRFQSRDTWGGDTNIPISYNLWAYANDNPILYTDQSGYCSGKQDDPANPDAECWREIEFIESTYTNVDIVSKRWKTTELKAVEKSLLFMTNTFGGSANFQFAFPNTIKLKRAGWLYSWLFQDHQGESALGFNTITILDAAFNENDDMGSFVVIHEFGHFFDARFNYPSTQSFKNKFWDNCTIDDYGECFESDPICKMPMISTYGTSSPKEDFAETFAAYVWSTQNNHDFSNIAGVIIFAEDERYEYMKNSIDNIKTAPH